MKQGKSPSPAVKQSTPVTKATDDADHKAHHPAQ
jgi:hypothetical protein